jgi:hypothetical protein
LGKRSRADSQSRPLMSKGSFWCTGEFQAA